MSGRARSSSRASSSARPTAAARLHALRWWLPAALALGVGFADLARGGVVIAPVLLTVAYLVLVPAALLRR